MSDAAQLLDRRHEFVLYFDVTDGNPNGDPDAGNAPRIDPETGQGLVTDVCLKRKIRNFVQLTRVEADGTKPADGYDIYVKERGILALQQKRAYAAKGLQPDGKTATVKDARDWMCRTFFDVRAFGAVMSTGKAGDEDAAPKPAANRAGDEGEAPKADLRKPGDRPRPAGAQKLWNCGQVRGPIQLSFARSVEPILSLEHAITRVALTNAGDTKLGQEVDAEGEQATSGQIGRKSTIPYGLYRAHGFVSPYLARDTGFTRADLDLLWEALVGMFEHDRSASRGVMATRALVVFEHASALGNHPSHKLFERVTHRRADGKEKRPARAFADYEIQVDDSEIDGVSIRRVI